MRATWVPICTSALSRNLANSRSHHRTRNILPPPTPRRRSPMDPRKSQVWPRASSEILPHARACLPTTHHTHCRPVHHPLPPPLVPCQHALRLTNPASLESLARPREETMAKLTLAMMAVAVCAAATLEVSAEPSADAPHAPPGCVPSPNSDGAGDEGHSCERRQSDLTRVRAYGGRARWNLRGRHVVFIHALTSHHKSHPPGRGPRRRWPRGSFRRRRR